MWEQRRRERGPPSSSATPDSGLESRLSHAEYMEAMVQKEMERQRAMLMGVAPEFSALDAAKAAAPAEPRISPAAQLQAMFPPAPAPAPWSPPAMVPPASRPWSPPSMVPPPSSAAPPSSVPPHRPWSPPSRAPSRHAASPGGLGRPPYESPSGASVPVSRGGHMSKADYLAVLTEQAEDKKARDRRRRQEEIAAERAMLAEGGGLMFREGGPTRARSAGANRAAGDAIPRRDVGSAGAPGGSGLSHAIAGRRAVNDYEPSAFSGAPPRRASILSDDGKADAERRRKQAYAEELRQQMEANAARKRAEKKVAEDYDRKYAGEPPVSARGGSRVTGGGGDPFRDAGGNILTDIRHRGADGPPAEPPAFATPAATSPSRASAEASPPPPQRRVLHANVNSSQIHDAVVQGADFSRFRAMDDVERTKAEQQRLARLRHAEELQKQVEEKKARLALEKERQRLEDLKLEERLRRDMAVEDAAKEAASAPAAAEPHQPPQPAPPSPRAEREAIRDRLFGLENDTAPPPAVPPAAAPSPTPADDATNDGGWSPGRRNLPSSRSIHRLISPDSASALGGAAWDGAPPRPGPAAYDRAPPGYDSVAQQQHEAAMARMLRQQEEMRLAMEQQMSMVSQLQRAVHDRDSVLVNLHQQQEQLRAGPRSPQRAIPPLPAAAAYHPPPAAPHYPPPAAPHHPPPGYQPSFSGRGTPPRHLVEPPAAPTPTLPASTEYLPADRPLPDASDGTDADLSLQFVGAARPFTAVPAIDPSVRSSSGTRPPAAVALMFEASLQSNSLWGEDPLTPASPPPSPPPPPPPGASELAAEAGRSMLAVEQSLDSDSKLVEVLEAARRFRASPARGTDADSDDSELSFSRVGWEMRTAALGDIVETPGDILEGEDDDDDEGDGYTTDPDFDRTAPLSPP